MAPFENTAEGKKQLMGALEKALITDTEWIAQEVYLERAARSGDPAFIPILKKFAERPTRDEVGELNATVVGRAVRSLRTLGVPQEYFFESAQRDEKTHRWLVQAAVGALEDPRDPNALAYLQKLKQKAKLGTALYGAVQSWQGTCSLARQFDKLPRSKQIEKAIYGISCGILSSNDYLGPKAGGLTGWIHSRFRDLCDKHPEEVALALFSRRQTVDDGDDVIPTEVVQQWVAQYMTEKARSTFEDLRSGRSTEASMREDLNSRSNANRVWFILVLLGIAFLIGCFLFFRNIRPHR